MKNNIGWKILSLFLALVLIAGAIVGVVFWQKGNIIFKPVEQTEQEQPDDGQDETADSGGAVISGSTESGISLMSAKIMTADYDEYGISPMAETAYQLTATIQPADATDKTVDWSVSFVNPSSAWASGKTVTDYVTVTPTSDGALTANVENLQAFGEQIKVTVTSRDNAEATAECVIDYAKRLTGVAVGLSYMAETINVNSSSEETVIPASFANLHYSGVTPVEGVGTISDEFTYTVKIKGSSTVANAISSGTSGQIITSANEVDFTSTDILLTSLEVFNKLYSVIQINAPAQDAADIIARESMNSPFAYITVSAVGEYSSYSCEMPLLATSGVLKVAVSSVSLSDNSLVF